MSAAKSALEINPLVDRLVKHDGELTVVRGYRGPSESDDVVRLYPVLGKLSHYMEIKAADIVETAPAPVNVLPHDGVIAWVDSEAEVKLHGDTIATVPARTLRGRRSAAETSRQSADYVDVDSGRLRMSVLANAQVRSDCEVCASCGPCSSCSGICQSGPA